jgi:hypothetical protein
MFWCLNLKLIIFIWILWDLSVCLSIYLSFIVKCHCNSVKYIDWHRLTRVKYIDWHRLTRVKYIHWHRLTRVKYIDWHRLTRVKSKIKHMWELRLGEYLKVFYNYDKITTDYFCAPSQKNGLDKISSKRCLQFCGTSLCCLKVQVKENVLNEKRRSKKQWEKYCKMKFRIVRTAVTNWFGEGFSLLTYKGTVRVTNGISSKLCHIVQN